MEMSAELLALDESYSGVPMRLTKQQQHIEVNTKGATTSAQEAEEDVCWICLAGHSEGEPLHQPCSCPKFVHQGCLAQWQMIQCGRSEETECRFCTKTLPDWRKALEGKPKAAPLMTVSHKGEVHVLQVDAGEEGRRAFEHKIRQIFGLRADEQISVTFGIKEPFTGTDLTLDGWNAWSAAVECAACSAATRPSTGVTECKEKQEQGVQRAESTASSSSPTGRARSTIYNRLQGWFGADS